MSLDEIIKKGNRAIDAAVERVIFRHTFQIEAMELAETLHLKGVSSNSVSVTRIHIDEKQNRRLIELLSVASGYFNPT